ncbi:Cna B-type domain-containing protein [Neoactinobaculum massilliense]|uniref:Cna B-type domain-containing protein n=1 Tax=Neoactinobaculum massilliense TaxID=2364794 RepID=UPI000F542409|nr:Cna B-type domain-containing protein [Neoactinobaculum massilliense]
MKDERTKHEGHIERYGGKALLALIAAIVLGFGAFTLTSLTPAHADAVEVVATDTLPAGTVITGHKTWDDGYGAHAQVSVNLLENGTVIATTKSALEDGSFQFDVSGLPAAATYTVEEAVVPNHYTVSYTQPALTSFDRGGVTGVTTYTPGNDLVIPLSELGDGSAWVVVKKGSDFTVWSPEKLTDAQLQQVGLQIGHGFGGKFAQVLTGTEASEAGIHFDGESVTFDAHSTWSLIVAGTVTVPSATFSPAAVVNRLNTTPIATLDPATPIPTEEATTPLTELTPATPVPTEKATTPAAEETTPAAEVTPAATLAPARTEASAPNASETKLANAGARTAGLTTAAAVLLLAGTVLVARRRHDA